MVAADPLIRTKLYRPALTGDHVSRARVLELMDRSLAVPLTVVSAPAGYGKSTLISEWLALQKCRSAWLSLDAAESELGTFLNYLLTAVDTIAADACSQTRALLAAPELPSAATLAAYLVNDLDRLDEPFLLVLDDYHSLRRSSSVHGLVEAMLEHAPRALHLVLISRNELPWSLTSLRAKGRVSEPWFRELCFTTAEAAEFLAAAGCAIDHVVVDKLDAQIEGWPVGWRLLLQALRRSSDSATVLDELTGTLPDIQAYLVGEVLERQAPAVREYLLRTALLDRFCPELVDAICRPDGEASGELDGRTFMDLLQREGLFGIALDPLNRWLRYHHVFQESLQTELRRQLPLTELHALHMRASLWLEQHGLIEDAIRHALAAASPVDAAKIVERHWREELDNERWSALGSWLELIPAAVKRQRPETLLALAWVAHFQGRFDLLRLFVAAIDSANAGDTPAPQELADVHLFKGVLAYWAGDASESLRHLETVRRLSPGREQIRECVAQVYLALARHRSGQVAAAHEALDDSLAADPPKAQFLARLLAGKAFIQLLSADARPVGRLGRQIEDLGVRERLNFMRAWGLYVQALSALQLHRLPEARDSFIRAFDARRLVDERAAADIIAGLAVTHQLLGETDLADTVAAELAVLAQESADPACPNVANSCRARLALLRGDVEAAIRWERRLDPDANVAPFVVWIEIPAITKIRVQVARTADHARAALAVIAKLRPELERAHFDGQAVEVIVLQALALEKLGDTTAALGALQEAVAMAAPGGWIRPFIEAPVEKLLMGLARSTDHGEFVQRALAGREAAGSLLRGAVQPTSTSTPPPTPTPVGGTGRPARAADLTNRELDILELVAQRLQSKEIAAQLHISDHTVKDHLKHIYQKLGVSKRGEAVAAAIAAGIIE